MSETFSELFEGQKEHLDIKQGSLITGEVAEITGSTVVINAGLKSEGIIPFDEFLDKDNELEVSVGDKVEVVLEALEDSLGTVRMSRTRARQLRVWKRLEEAHKDNLTIKGIFVERVKGGFTVDIDGVAAFLPGSLTDVRPMRESNYSYLENKEIECKVIKLDHRRNNIVVSRRAVLESEGSAEREEAVKNIKEGAVVKGIVKHLTNYGAFIGFNGFDGLLHITDIAWKRIRDPADVLTVGDEIEVKVLNYDKEKNRISLGLKQMTEDPWRELVSRYPEGTRTTGKVTNLTEYGCFVELEESIEGLVHVSEMDWANKNVMPSKIVSVGDEVEVAVIGIDKDKRRISLGFKQCTPNPWEEFSKQYAKGSKFKGQIKSINDFGIFVGIPGTEIDGLVHTRDVSATEPIEKAVLKYKKGDEVEVIVVATDVEKERITLSIKALQDDVVQDYFDQHGKGSIVNGKVIGIEEKWVWVQLSDKVKGVVFLSDFKQEDGRVSVSEGDEIEAKLIGIDRKNFAIKLSVKEKEKEEEAQAVKEYSVKKESAGTSLGNHIRDKGDSILDTIKHLFKKK